MINLELYRIFKTVAEEEKLTKASEILHISQPAVTKHIKNLENELGVDLFKRSKYGMILNENGKKLYMQIRDSIEILSKSDAIFKTNKDIELGVHVNMPNQIYNKGISNFYEKNNCNIVNIHRLNAINMFSALAKQEIDAVFSKRYSDELYDANKIKFINIGEFHDVFIVTSNSKYLNKKLSKMDLRNTTIYTLKKFSSAYKNLIEMLEYKVNDKINISNIALPGIMELFKVRDIIAVITKEYVEDKLENKELSILDVGFSLPTVEYGIYYNVNNKFKELNNLIDVFKSSYKV